jgi:hypothetical protein
MSRWIDQARARVREVTRDLPAEATLPQRRKALRAAGSLFHGGTYWGRKQWGRAVREYLAQHGGPPVAKASPADVHRLHELEDRGDITFPFREARP